MSFSAQQEGMLETADFTHDNNKKKIFFSCSCSMTSFIIQCVSEYTIYTYYIVRGGILLHTILHSGRYHYSDEICSVHHYNLVSFSLLIAGLLRGPLLKKKSLVTTYKCSYRQ